MTSERRRWKSSLYWLVVSVLAIGCTEGSDGGGGGQGGAGGAMVDMSGPGGAGGAGGMGGAGGAPPRDMAVRDAALPACSDGFDNDGDGLVDGADPGCEGPEDGDELDPPACANGVDDDADGFIDFPEDPGCGSTFDDDEFNEPVAPQCNDGVDNDRDGLVDEADPGCASVADPRETDPDTPPQCFNRIDDDGDGIIDFPLEPGCSTAGDDDEADPPQPPACANGADDDGDGSVDYPEDPGCAGVGDRDETDKAVTPRCSDGIDNDRDGKTDFPEDDGCTSAADYDERGTCGDTYDPPGLSDGQSLVIDSRRGEFESEGSCGGRGSPEVVFFYKLTRDVEALEITTDLPATEAYTTLYVRRTACLDTSTEVGCQAEDVRSGNPGHTLRLENLRRGDYYIFADGVTGRGGLIEIQVNEIPLAACLNRLDDDRDGKVDYPSDPGCEFPQDRDEEDPLQLPACTNDEDDDGDGFVDYPLDLGCVSAAGDSEVDICGQGVRFREFFWDQGSIVANTQVERGGTNDSVGSCGGQNAPEVIYYFNNPFNARLTFSTRHDETQIPTALYVRRTCDNRQSELECDAGEGDEDGQRGLVTLDNAAVGTYFVVVDTGFGQGGQFKLSLEYERLDPGCVDGQDNDGDGLVDGEDPGCDGPQDEDERDPPAGAPLAICNNLMDDDGDGLIDFPFDPGCIARGDDDEADPPVLAACANGVDDDGDGDIDFPDDAGCQAAGDDDENDPRPRPACSNRIDDDDDGLIDYPFDPGCIAAGDGGEGDPNPLPACSDGIDNDRDGIADFPFDPGCLSAGHPFEDDLPPDQAPACDNGLDDDGDGLIDFPIDPGCDWAAEDDETSPAFPPQCANGRDDDQNGRIDFPDDPGCRYAADRFEENDGQIPPRCGDGVDNDLDGFVDLQDLGCLDPEDDDETDEAGDAPLCGNGADDDEDGLTDWPDDPGCQARGDRTEDQSCRPEVNTPLIPPNGSVMGQTADGGMDVYHHRCGGRMAPDAVYRYVLEQPGDLVVSADNPGTDYPVVLAVRTDCEEPDSMISCAGNFAAPVPTVTLRNADAGEYFIFVDGGGPEQWVSSNGNVAMPADPRNFQGGDDIRDNCGWSDGGNDAFDCYGRFTVTHAGQASAPSIVIGRRNANAGAYNYIVDSAKPHPSVWRVQFLPAEDFDERPVDIQITGNLGSDGSTVAQRGAIDVLGRQVAWLQTSDGRAGDPPVHHLLVPSDPEQLGQVQYANNGDNVTITANQVKLPVTFYVGLSYGNRDAVFQALVDDIEIQAGPGGDDAPRFGNFEITVEEQR
ncbi:MAG: hypothetical protein H6702_00530 [Myxococcales bacterium]|nr:hypothetical protein [Myxococcales bacterium]